MLCPLSPTRFLVVGMVKATMDIRLKAVVLYSEGVKSGKEISQSYEISERTLRRWARAYENDGIEGLKPQPTTPKRFKKAAPTLLVRRIISLKRKYPSWGARRLKHQFDLPLSWRTVHKILKNNGLLFRINAKPQPCKRFQRRHVDSMWQGDTFQFRIAGVGKVYATGFTDDCSRFRVRSKVYLRKGAEEAVNCLVWALRPGRKPRQIYLDNGTQFISRIFKAEAEKHGIDLVFGRPYHPRGRGKIEAYHKVLHRELISLKVFSSLSHFRKELWKFDRIYNYWRKQEILGWHTPAEVYFDKKRFNKNALNIKKRTYVRSTKADKC
jgi:transposase InsO family protein